MKANCKADVFKWYTKEHKNKLTKILDSYNHSGQKISKYVTCINISNLHWIVLIVDISKSAEEESFVTTIDSLKGQDYFASKCRVWYAKFFELYLREIHNGKICYDDLDISDIKATLNLQPTTVETKQSIKVKQFVTEPDAYQSDGYNCGIFCIIKMIELLKGSSIVKKHQHELKEMCAIF